MAEEDSLDRRVRKLAVEHAETRWLTLRLDDDVKELREDLRVVRATQDQHTEVFQEHTVRFDSVDAQLRSLTQLVGQVLDRLPGNEDEG